MVILTIQRVNITIHHCNSTNITFRHISNKVRKSTIVHVYQSKSNPFTCISGNVIIRCHFSTVNMKPTQTLRLNLSAAQLKF